MISPAQTDLVSRLWEICHRLFENICFGKLDQMQVPLSVGFLSSQQGHITGQMSSDSFKDTFWGGDRSCFVIVSVARWHCASHVAVSKCLLNQIIVNRLFGLTILLGAMEIIPRNMR